MAAAPGRGVEHPCTSKPRLSASPRGRRHHQRQTPPHTPPPKSAEGVTDYRALLLICDLQRLYCIHGLPPLFQLKLSVAFPLGMGKNHKGYRKVKYKKIFQRVILTSPPSNVKKWGILGGGLRSCFRTLGSLVRQRSQLRHFLETGTEAGAGDVPLALLPSGSARRHQKKSWIWGMCLGRH